MAINLLDLLKSQIGSGSTVSMISKVLGESESGTQTAINAALPTLLGSVVKGASTTEGSKGLMDLIKTGGHDGGILDNLPSVLGGGAATNNLMNSGSSLLSTFLGDKLGGIVSLLGSLSGLKGGSISSLLSMVAPLILGSIGKQVSSQGLGISGLANLLMGQSDFIKSAVPTGVSSLLGFGDLGDFKGAANKASETVTHTTRTVERAVENTVEEASSGFGKWLPWLLGALLLGGLFWGLRGCNAEKAVDKAVDTTVKAADATADAAKKAADATADAAKAATDAAANAAQKVVDMFKVKLPDGIELNVPKGSIEDLMIAFMSDAKAPIDKNKWFDFDRLYFDTGKATLKPESAETLKNVAAIMKAFPKVKIKIGGYTDNVGDAKSNLKLSTDRAKNTMMELVKLGVAANRMTSEGYGQEHPIASNDTEEGKAKNRRISISVREK